VETIVAAGEAVAWCRMPARAAGGRPRQIPRRTVGEVLTGQGGAPLVIIADGIQDQKPRLLLQAPTPRARPDSS
jgi:hypothetical protein